MKTLLTGMPYKPSTLPQDVQATWRKHGWRPKHERQHRQYKPGLFADDYDLVERTSHLDMIRSA